MDLEYDYLGNFADFNYDNVESAIKTLVPSASTADLTFNDSLEHQSDVEDFAGSNSIKKAVITETDTLIDSASNKRGKRTTKCNQNKYNTRKANKCQSSNSYNEGQSSDEDLNNELFSILDKPANLTSSTQNIPISRNKKASRRSLAQAMPIKECVDLSELPKTRSKNRRDPNIVVIGSDDEYDDLKFAPIAINLKTSDNHLHNDLDLENPEYKIKIQWRSKIELHSLRKFQKFSDLMKILAVRENCDFEDILLNLNSTIISSNDSPNSINYKISDIINGRIVKNSNIVSTIKKNDDDLIIKLIAKEWKRPMEISVNKNDSISILYIKISEEIKSSPDKFVLMFDGEILKNNCKESVVEGLELENGELLEIYFKN